jgi:hypothetical protein
MATCFDSTDSSSSGLLKNRSNVSKFIVHSGIPSVWIPECTTNFDILDLFFRRSDDDSIQSKHVSIIIFYVINCV